MSGPRSRRMFCCSTIPGSPPIAEPTTMPTRSGSTSFKPPSRQAPCAAPSASRTFHPSGAPPSPARPWPGRALHFAGNPDRVLARVERLDEVDAALARDGRLPRRARVETERRDRAQPGDGDPSHPPIVRGCVVPTVERLFPLAGLDRRALLTQRLLREEILQCSSTAGHRLPRPGSAARPRRSPRCPPASRPAREAGTRRSRDAPSRTSRRTGLAFRSAPCRAAASRVRRGSRPPAIIDGDAPWAVSRRRSRSDCSVSTRWCSSRSISCGSSKSASPPSSIRLTFSLLPRSPRRCA